MSSLPALKTVCRMEYGESLPQEVRTDGDVPVFGSNGVAGSNGSANTMAPAILVGRKGSFGKVTWTDVPGFCIDTAYFIDRRHTGANLRWLYWALQTLGLDVHSEDTGVPGLSREKAYQSKLRVPDLAEQQRIANFLDEQTARIDSLIAEKNALYGLIEEEKQSCIDREVFGGQPPLQTFPYTPATAEVRGVIWSRCMLKQKWQVTDCKHLTVEFHDEGFPLASIREVSDGVLNLQDAKRAAHADYKGLIEGGRKPKRGDLIYARNASVGAAALVDTDDLFAMGQDVCLITSANQDQAFLRLQLMSTPLKAQLESLLLGATIRRINVEQIRGFCLLVPPVSVQREVITSVAGQLERRERLQAHVAHHIDRLREYRSSLISAAVTGQLNIAEYKEAA